MSDLMKASEKSRSVRLEDGVLAVVLLHHPLGATNLDFRRELSEYLEEGIQGQVFDHLVSEVLSYSSHC